jgi:hypothetical protein
MTPVIPPEKFFTGTNKGTGLRARALVRAEMGCGSGRTTLTSPSMGNIHANRCNVGHMPTACC